MSTKLGGRELTLAKLGLTAIITIGSSVDISSYILTNLWNLKNLV